MNDNTPFKPNLAQLESVVVQYQAMVRWQLSRFVKDRHVVDDLAQDVFFAWCQANQQGVSVNSKSPESPGGWLMAVARNKAVDWLRANCKQAIGTSKSQAAFEMARLVSSAMSEEHVSSFDNQTRLEALRHCVRLLQPEHREIVHEFYGLGKSSELIGMRIGKGSSGVRMILTRIRRALAKCIRKQLEKNDE